MSKVIYDVVVMCEHYHQAIAYDRVNSETKAAKQAIKFVEQYPGNQVYVEFFNGQTTGYLNQDGNHDVTGRAWEVR